MSSIPRLRGLAVDDHPLTAVTFVAILTRDDP
jgi:hypothetical protein